MGKGNRGLSGNLADGTAQEQSVGWLQEELRDVCGWC